MHALFINPGGIGDQILLLPAVKLLKENYPDYHIDLLCEPRSSCIGELTNLYRKIKEFDFKDKNPEIFSLREIIRRRRYKYVISTGSSYKANFVTALAGGIFGVGILRNGFRDQKFLKVLENTVILLFIAIVFVILAAIIEVYFTPILFK